jgi:hypothetical protein
VAGYRLIDDVLEKLTAAVASFECIAFNHFFQMPLKLHSAGRSSNIRVIIQAQGQEFPGSSVSMSRSVSFSQSSRSFLTFR